MTESNIEAVINKCVDDIWEQYDSDKNGKLDLDETRKFVKQTLGEMESGSNSDFSEEDF